MDEPENPPVEDPKEEEAVEGEVEDPQEPQDIEDAIAEKEAEAQALLMEAEALKLTKDEEEKQKEEELKHIPTAFTVHTEAIKVSEEPPVCDMHITIHIPAQDITFHEKVELTKSLDTPEKRRNWIRADLEELIIKHAPPVYVQNYGTDVVGKWSLDGEFDELAGKLVDSYTRETLDDIALKWGLLPKQYDTKADIANAIVLKQWRPLA